jgi:hypothetical protein
MKLWLDDERYPPPEPEWHWCKNAPEALIYVLRWGHQVDEWSLDHDLAMEDIDGAWFLRCILFAIICNGAHIRVPAIRIHSANPAGRENMLALIKDIREYVGGGCPTDCEWSCSTWASEGAPCPRHS